MRSIAFVVVILLASCQDRELDLAQQILLAEDAEAAARRELVRLESGKPKSPELDKQIAAQRALVRAAEITARKLRIQSKQ